MGEIIEGQVAELDSSAGFLQDLYQAVAEILIFIYKMNNKVLPES